MGYAQIAGLPPQYGLYGSVLPVLLFGLFSSSPQYIFGVDAAPAALVGGTLVSAGDSVLLRGGDELCPCDNVLCRRVAADILSDRFRKADTLRLISRDGRFYHGHLHDHNSYADTEAYGRTVGHG